MPRRYSIYVCTIHVFSSVLFLLAFDWCTLFY
jgi:hypothetical protein